LSKYYCIVQVSAIRIYRDYIDLLQTPGPKRDRLNSRGLILTSQDVRNAIGQRQGDPAIELHTAVTSSEDFVIAYKPQNFSLQESTTLGFLPELENNFGWAEFLQDDQFFLVLGSSFSLSCLRNCNHIAMDATHNSCDVRVWNRISI